MSDVLILEFTGATADHYQAVNKILDANAGSGDDALPPTLTSHTAGTTDGGDLVVVEIWESKADQADFMQRRLGPALAEAGVPEPTRAEWLTLQGHHET